MDLVSNQGRTGNVLDGFSHIFSGSLEINHPSEKDVESYRETKMADSSLFSFLRLLPMFQPAPLPTVRRRLLSPGGTSLCRVYGYVPPTRVDFSRPKIQNRPQILKFYSRTGPTF